MKIAVLLAIVALIYAGCVKDPDLNEEDPTQNEADKVSIISIAPSGGPAGTRVVIKGAHFGASLSANTVRFNNDSAAVLASSIDSLVVMAPASGTTGAVTVAVAGNTATGPVFTYTKDSVIITDSVDVYAAAPAEGVVYWKNGKQIYLATTQGNTGGAYSLAVSDTNVYVGGYTYFGTYPAFEAAYWKNQQKTALSSPDSAGQARALVLSGNDLYVGGSENSRPVYWKNGVKHSLPMFGGGYARVNALAINGNDVYAAGYEAGPNNEERLVYWKNDVETLLGKAGMIDIGAASIAVNGNDVYVCGTDSGAALYWKNGVRVVLEQSPANAPVQATAIAIKNNSVYVTGSYQSDAVYWKDGVRTTLPKKGYSAAATVIAFYQSDIYIGGRDGGAVYWKNGVRTSLCCSDLGVVSSMAVVKRR